VLAVVGTRPEAIKMAPVVAALRKTDRVETRLALTGQHSDLLDQALGAFRLEPDYDLGIMRVGQTLYDVGQGCLEGLKEVVQAYRPDMVLVQGDTATVFFASLVAFFEKIPVGHIEAGLRSGEKWAPFPEEVFRRLTDVITDLHFAPTPRAAKTLLAEGVRPEQVHVTGNTVVDALLHVISADREPEDPTLAAVIADVDSRLVLLTAHRRESFGQPLRDVFASVRKIADEHPDVEILYPVHPNPNVTQPATELLGNHPRIHLVEPLTYLDLVTALKHAHLILTDSGGIQEEAPTFGAPVLVLRDVTERPEGIEAGVARLVGTDGERILAEARELLAGGAPSTDDAEGSEGASNPYGDGKSGERIADIVVSTLTGSPRSTSDWEGP
jgi:UDP-N-acetylglucosamine 2-epimerase (non-hydrolysing)